MGKAAAVVLGAFGAMAAEAPGNLQAPRPALPAGAGAMGGR